MAFPKLTASPQPPLNLSERIGALRSEIDAFIDAKAEELKAGAPGIPLQVIRNDLTRRSECQCRTFLTLTGELK